MGYNKASSPGPGEVYDSVRARGVVELEALLIFGGGFGTRPESGQAVPKAVQNVPQVGEIGRPGGDRGFPFPRPSLRERVHEISESRASEVGIGFSLPATQNEISDDCEDVQNQDYLENGRQEVFEHGTRPVGVYHCVSTPIYRQ